MKFLNLKKIKGSKNTKNIFFFEIEKIQKQLELLRRKEIFGICITDKEVNLSKTLKNKLYREPQNLKMRIVISNLFLQENIISSCEYKPKKIL